MLAALADTLDPGEAARRLADICVRRIADYAAVDLLEPDGSLGPTAAAHREPSARDVVSQLRALRPLSADSPRGRARVLREGQGEMVDVTDEQLRAVARSEAELAFLRDLGLRSYICVPILARGRTVGALTLLTAASDRRLTHDDFELATQLGRQAGAAIDNALLFEAANVRRAELDAVLAAMAEAVMVFDPRGRLRLHNRSARELFANEVPPTIDALRERLGPREEEPGAHGDVVVGTAPDVGGEYQLPESERWIDVRQYAVRRPEAMAPADRPPIVVVIRDVTQARLAQVVRESFLGMMSHELRTPITTIYGGSQLLEHDLDEERRAEVIRDIRGEAERLVKLVEDLLVMTRVERGGIEIADEPLLLQRLLPRIVESVAASWAGLRVDLEIAPRLPAVRGDATYLEQVTRNLITNAVRYGEGLAAGLTVHAEAADSEVIVRLLDRGPGLGETDPERLFDIFYRAPAARAVSGGAGIGLFVSRALIEAMGGRIWARDRSDGGGAEFGFALAIVDAD